MKHFEVFKLTSDLMVGDMIAGHPELNEIQFDVEFFGDLYTVYYQKKIWDGKPVWVMVDFENK